MRRSDFERLGKKITIIYAGDYYVGTDDEVIETTLGSCIAVTLYDSAQKIGGMNHFMLPEKNDQRDYVEEKQAKFGTVAIMELLEEMYKKGAQKKNLQAKIFGGGNVLTEREATNISILRDNSVLAKVFIELEDIPIVEEDVGGKFMRKVILDVQTGKVYVKKTVRRQIEELHRKSKKNH